MKHTLALIAALLVGLALFGWVETFSSSFQACISEQTSYQAKKPTEGNEAVVKIISFARCSGRFVNDHNGGITALATLLIAAFTATIWGINQSQLRHARDVDRAYVSGGGPGNPPHGPFVLHINNYGRTPAALLEYAVEFCELSAIPPNPDYLDRNYRRRSIGRGIFPPGAHGWEIEQFQYQHMNLREPVVYGRFWYEDVWKRLRFSSFILRLPPDVLPTNISPHYTEWS